MSNSAKIVFGLGLLTVVAACARQEPQAPMTYSEPAAPIQAEPTYSKY